MLLHSINITFIHTGELKKFMWLILLWYSLYCYGLEPNSQCLQGMPVIVVDQHNAKYVKWCILAIESLLSLSPKFRCWNLYFPSVMVFGGKNFGRRLITSQMRVKTQRVLSPLPHVWRQRYDSCLQKYVLTEHWICWYLDLRLPSLQKCEK